MERTNIFLDGQITGYNPDGDGDIYDVSDQIRDFNYMQGKIAQAIKGISSLPNSDFLILYGGEITDGGSGTINISEGLAIGKNANGDTRFVFIPELTGVALPAGWNDDRQIWVVGQHSWKIGSLSRTHRTVNSEQYNYTVEDSYAGESTTDDFFVDSDPGETVVCWGSFKMNGTVFSDGSTIDRSNIFTTQSTHEAVVDSQRAFNNCIEKVTANEYKIKDGIYSLHLKYKPNGYYCFGNESFLSDGDTWGVVQINNVKNFTADYGVYLAIGDTNFYISLNGSDKYLKNIWLKGIGATAITGQYSFKIETGVGGIIFDTCKVSNRSIGNTNAHYAFSGVSPANKLTRLLSCTVSEMELGGSEGLFCFQYFNHADNCIVENISGGNGVLFGFAYVGNMTNCRVIDSTLVYGSYHAFYYSLRIGNCWVSNLITTSSGSVEGFSNCDNVSNCVMEYCTSSGSGRCRAFDTCNVISTCLAHDLTSESGEVIAFAECEVLSACRYYGFTTTSGNIVGYYWAKYGSSLRGISSYANEYNDYIDTAIGVTNPNSSPSIFT